MQPEFESYIVLQGKMQETTVRLLNLNISGESNDTSMLQVTCMGLH